MSSLPTTTGRLRRWAAVGLSAGLASVLAACGSSGGTAAGSSTTASTAAGSSTSATAAAKATTISTAQVPGFGTVLVNSDGRTLYMLTSERGGKVTCTDATGCTALWAPTELAQGATSATAGTGVKASLLGTAKGPSGSLRVTYGGWPLYTYSGDSAAGEANGEGITSFGGTWYVLDANGNPVTSKM